MALCVMFLLLDDLYGSLYTCLYMFYCNKVYVSLHAVGILLESLMWFFI